MRPRTLDEFVGQEHLVGEGRLLRTLLDRGTLQNLILWGPPGTGKTTFARLYAEHVGAVFHPISAVQGGVKDVREAVEGARLRAMVDRTRTLLFVDEIHRFSKTQQDALLPHVERGVVSLVGATTENPSFELTNALRSRCRVVQLVPLDDDALAILLERALDDSERGLGPTAPALSEAAVRAILAGAGGDARMALQSLELAAELAASQAEPGARGLISLEHIEQAQQRRHVSYDRSGDHHFQVASAFIKSMRGSDPYAALFYMVRMLEAGEQPEFVARRMIIFASEDVGNADPSALGVAVAALDALQAVGMPEASLALTQACTYLACAPKSNSALLAYAKARRDVLQHANLPVPKHLVNAPTAMMKSMGYGGGYKYPHDFEGHYVPQRHLPDRIRDHVYYEPSAEGREAEIGERLAQWRAAARDDEG